MANAGKGLFLACCSIFPLPGGVQSAIVLGVASIVRQGRVSWNNNNTMEGPFPVSGGAFLYHVGECAGAASLLNSCGCLTIGEGPALLEARGLAEALRMGPSVCGKIVMQAEFQLSRAMKSP